METTLNSFSFLAEDEHLEYVGKYISINTEENLIKYVQLLDNNRST